ncbi:MAG TPA: ThiF family adenylyltransferase, partial [Treponemataceae bacterium]|nr:ThiF family adenylyltransferase [Treponemataceae bacterium]
MQTASNCSENEQFSRTIKLIGTDNVQLLNNSKIAVFGLGGVGSYVVEALVRAGVGSFILIDSDTICESNINRQLIALHSTLGRAKVEVEKERIMDINPKAKVETHKL